MSENNTLKNNSYDVALGIMIWNRKLKVRSPSLLSFQGYANRIESLIFIIIRKLKYFNLGSLTRLHEIQLSSFMR